MDTKNIIHFSSLSLAISVLVFLFSLFLLSCIGFIFHLGINIFYLPLSLIISQGVNYYLLCEKYKFPKRIFVINSLIFLVLILLSCAVTMSFCDYSYDGRTYHQAQIMLLSQGWNPVYDLDYIIKNYPTALYHLPWIEGYTKFTEAVQANILILFKDIEASKMTHIISAIMLFAYSFYIFGKKEFAKNNIFIRVAISLILTLNPVSLAQIQTFYVDSYTYVFFMMLLLAVIDLETEPEESSKTFPFAIIIMSAVCFLNIKFWSYIYFCTTGFIYFLYLLKNKQSEKIKKVILSSLIILILVIITGLSPYLSNLRQGRNIIYPVLGSKEALNVMDMNIPKSLHGKNYLHQFFISTFSRVDNFRKMDNREHQLKMPFEVNSEEFNYLRGYDTRLCGFGIFWSGILLTACLLACFIRYRKRKIYLLVFLFLLSNLLFQPFSWWARFIPQLWAFPVFTALYFLTEEDISKPKRLTALFLLAVMFLNITIQSYFVIQTGKDYKKLVGQVMASLVKRNQTVQIYTIYDWSVIEKLRENGIKTEFVSEDYYNKNKEKFDFVIPQLENNMYWALK